MKKIFFFCLVLCVITADAADKNKKLAQTGFKFLNVATDPRSVAMGEAVTSVEGTSQSLFFNPAGMARMSQSVQMTFGSTQWIADINHMYGSIAINTPDNDYGVFGITFQTVDYGDLDRTIYTESNADKYLDMGTFSPIAMAVGIGYARSLSDRFSIGGRISYALQDLGDGFATTTSGTNNPVASKNSANTLSYDFGMFYKTGLKSLNFAVSIKNFSKEIKYQREGFQLPLMFRIGISANTMDFISESQDADQLLLSVDATNSRDYPETINLGGEYVFMKLLAIRAGYMFDQDEHGFTAGVGIQQSLEGIGLGIDYAYTPFGIFGNINRFSIQLYL
jgi:hypothetical protein